MTDFNTLCKISYVTDCDTELYSVGEVSGGFNENFKSFMSRYKKDGRDRLLYVLNRLITEVINEYDDIKNEEFDTNCVAISANPDIQLIDDFYSTTSNQVDCIYDDMIPYDDQDFYDDTFEGK